MFGNLGYIPPLNPETYLEVRGCSGEKQGCNLTQGLGLRVEGLGFRVAMAIALL